MNTGPSHPEANAVPDESVLDALLHGEFQREAAELGEDAAFSAALLSRLPMSLSPMPVTAKPWPWLHLLNSVSLAAVLALLLLTLPDWRYLLSVPLASISSPALTGLLKQLLPSLALLALLSWWSWQYVREPA